jgi:Holliday junction resolvasome RuvABC ATP-dependent DNA helicase subunit
LEDDVDYLEFLVSSAGSFSISRVRRGRLEPFVAWTVCAAVRSGNALNLLELRRLSDDVYFFINSELVQVLPASVVMQDLPDNFFGFALRGHIKVRAHFLNIHSLEAPRKSNEYQSRDKKLESSGIEHPAPTVDSIEKIMRELNVLTGLENVKRTFVTVRNTGQVRKSRLKHRLTCPEGSLHIAFCGSAGTGKTTVARLMGRLYRSVGLLETGHVLEVDQAGLFGGYLGQTAHRTNHAVEQALGGVLFIDEAHVLANSSYGEEVLNVLVKRMEDHRSELAVVFAGYRHEMTEMLRSNPGLRSRIGRVIDFADYTARELLSVFDGFCNQYGFVVEPAARDVLLVLFEVAVDMAGRGFGNARFARSVFDRVLEFQANRLVSIQMMPDDLQTIRLEDVMSLESLLPVSKLLN